MSRPGGASSQPRRTDRRRIEVEPLSDRQFDAWDNFGLPETEEILAGVWAIAIPTAPPGYVYCYAVETSRGIVMIDTGLDTNGGLDRLVTEIGAIGFSVGDIEAVLCTHYHKDHFGNVGGLQVMIAPWVGMHAADIGVLARLAQGNRDAQRQLWRSFGIEAIDAEGLARSGNPYYRHAPGRPNGVIAHGDRLDFGTRSFQAIWTPGHSPGHLCFLETGSRALFAGDLILPAITTGVSIQTTQRANPLGDFLGSVRLVGDLDVDVVLPGHEFAFRGLEERIAGLLRHHDVRLGEILAALQAGTGLSSARISSAISWSRPWPEMTGTYERMAIAETMAHLVLLEERGLVLRSGRDPVLWMRAGDALAALPREMGGG